MPFHCSSSLVRVPLFVLSCEGSTLRPHLCQSTFRSFLRALLVTGPARRVRCIIAWGPDGVFFTARWSCYRSDRGIAQAFLQKWPWWISIYVSRWQNALGVKVVVVKGVCLLRKGAFGFRVPPSSKLARGLGSGRSLATSTCNDGLDAYWRRRLRKL